MLEFHQLYSARLLQPGEHEKVRVKPSDAKYVVQLAYIGEGGRDLSVAVAPEDSVSMTSSLHHRYQHCTCTVYCKPDSQYDTDEISVTSITGVAGKIYSFCRS